MTATEFTLFFLMRKFLLITKLPDNTDRQRQR